MDNEKKEISYSLLVAISFGINLFYLGVVMLVIFILDHFIFNSGHYWLITMILFGIVQIYQNSKHMSQAVTYRLWFEDLQEKNKL